MALPFVVQPRRTTVIERVGTEKSGILEIERRGYLTTGEMAFVQQQTTSDDSTEKLLDLVQKVSKKFKIIPKRPTSTSQQLPPGAMTKAP